MQHRLLLAGRHCSSLATCVAACSALLAPRALARQSAFSDGPTSQITWPLATVSGVPTRAVAGDFSGDHDADVVYLTEGGGALLVYGPGVYSAFVPFAGGIRDIARVPSTTSGAADELLLLREDGLVCLSGYSAGAFAETPAAGGEAWLTAARVVSGDADGDGRLDAVGVAQDGRTILFSSDLHTPSTTPTSFALPFDVLDLVVLDWSPAAAIAILTSGGLYVRRWDGTLVEDYVGGVFESGSLVPLREAGQAGERLAVLYTVPGQGDYLGVLDPGGPAAPRALGDIGAYAACAGDVDADGLDDLVVLQRTNHYALLFRNRGGGDSFAAPVAVDCGLGAEGASGQSAAPVLVDLSNDGDLDLFVHIELSTSLALLENHAHDHRPLTPLVDQGHYLYSELEGEGLLELELLQPAGLPFEPTDLELIVWVQDPAGASMSPQAVQHEFYPYDGSGPALTHIPIHEAQLATSQLYHLELRSVLREPGYPLVVGPTAVWSFATPTEEVEALELQYGNTGVPIRIFLLDESRFLTLADTEERVLTPSAVPGDKLPPVDEPPDPFDDL